MQEPPTPGPFYKVKQIAKMLETTEETVRTWLNREDDPLPHYRPGREYLIAVEDFNKWLARQKKP